jgi:hypothetical protein
MTSEVSNIPVSVDYTSRDYYAIREDLINLVKLRVNQDSSRQWSGDDPADFGVALIEAFAYVGDLTNYYIDRIANETYLPTATQRKSILNLASLYGYAATGYSAATLQLTFSNTYEVEITGVSGSGTEITYTAPGHIVKVGDLVTISGVDPVGYNLEDEEVTAVTETTFTVAGTVTTTYVSGGVAGKSFELPQGTQVSGTVIQEDLVEEVIFTTSEDALVLPLGSTLVYADHGEDISKRSENLPVGPNDIAGELLGTSNGAPNQVYSLSENEVVEQTLEVYVQSGDIFEPWEKVTKLTDFGPSDAVYATEIDENNFVYVVFGDGVSGAIPSNNGEIKVVYRVGGGAIGNISTGVISSIDYVPGLTFSEFNSLLSYVFVQNSSPDTGVGVGGSEPEDNASIRSNAIRALRANNRAVSLEDYADLALLVGNVGKAKATAEVWTSTTLYIAPVRNVGDLDPFPGKDGSNSSVRPEWDNIKAETEQFFADKLLAGATLTIVPPTYVPVKIDVSFVKNEQFTADQTRSEILQTIITEFSYAYADFQQVITPEQMESVISRLRSIRNVKVTVLCRADAEVEARSPLIGEPDEIFVFAEADMQVSEASNNANLTTLTASEGTFSPTFDGEWYVYNLTGVTGNITLTPTAATASSILVNGVQTTSGSASASLTIPIGTTVVPVVVTAQDGITVKVYTITVTRSS